MDPNLPLVRNEYQKLAKTYEFRWQHYLERTNAATIQFLPELVDSTVLDIGCGTGELLYQISNLSQCSALYGMDCSEAMLDRAQKRLKGSAHLVVADASSLPYSNHVFSIVITSNVLHYIKHLGAFFSEIQRVLSESGTLLVTCWDDDCSIMKLRHTCRGDRSRAPVFYHNSSDIAMALQHARLAIKQSYRFNAGFLWRLNTWVVESCRRNDRQRQ